MLVSDPRSSIGIGRYELGECLGQGGLGVVHAAHDPQLQREVAIKLIHPQGGFAHADERLLREARAIARLNHPNVVQVFDLGSFARPGDRRGLFVVMQRLEGETVDAWLQRNPPWEDVLAVFMQAARGLAAAHTAGVVHRDLKPANMFLCSDGVVKVLDFGLAKITLESDADRLRTTLRSSADLYESLEDLDVDTTYEGMVIGTPAYMAPEQHAGDVADPACDQFAFCAALWRGLFGIRPFAGRTARELATAKFDGRIAPPPGRCAVPTWVEAAVRRGLAPHPAKRWPTMDDLIDALERRRSRTGLRRIAAASLVAGVLGFALPSEPASPHATPSQAGALACITPDAAAPERHAFPPSLDVLVPSWRAPAPVNSTGEPPAVLTADASR